MKRPIVEKHTPEEILKFAQEIDIDPELAKKIEGKREWYILWEHDYIKKVIHA